MSFLFLSFIYPKEREKAIFKKCKDGAQGAANTFQWALLEGLKELLREDLEVANTLPVGSYPNHYSELIVHGEDKRNRNVLIDKELGYINLPVIKQICRFYRVLVDCNRWLRRQDNETIICYSLYGPYLLALYLLKKKYGSRMNLCVIVTDLFLREGIMRSAFSLGGIYDRLAGAIVYSLLDCIDSYVILTEKMKVPLKVGRKPYVVIEGIASTDIRENKRPNDSLVRIVYTGTLDARFGVKDLLEAFRYIEDERYRLCLCGAGPLVEHIKRTLRDDPRVEYYGYLSKKEVNSLQAAATLLVNPRTNSEGYNKYSFPSKTIEYMLAGRPVLMHKLDGLPYEYYEYLSFFRSDRNEASEMADEIIDICQRDPARLDEMGREAREFLIRQKSSLAQASKMKKMLINSTRGRQASSFCG